MLGHRHHHHPTFQTNPHRSQREYDKKAIPGISLKLYNFTLFRLFDKIDFFSYFCDLGFQVGSNVQHNSHSSSYISPSRDNDRIVWPNEKTTSAQRQANSHSDQSHVLKNKGNIAQTQWTPIDMQPPVRFGTTNGKPDEEPPRPVYVKKQNQDITQRPPFNTYESYNKQTSKHAGVQPPTGLHQPSQTFNTEKIPNNHSPEIVDEKLYPNGYGSAILWPPSNFNIPGHTFGLEAEKSRKVEYSPVNNQENKKYPPSEPTVTQKSEQILNGANENNKKSTCPPGFSGLLPHSNCSKFLSCSNGRSFELDCSPGTR